MKVHVYLACALMIGIISTQFLNSQTDSNPFNSVRPRFAENYGNLPLSFEENRGQTDGRILFTSHGNGYSLFLSNTEAVLLLSKKAADIRPRIKPNPGANTEPSQTKTDVVRLQLAGAQAGIKVASEDKLPGTANYFIGDDPAKWRTSVPTYAKVKYSGVYPGVDLLYYGNQRQLEYDFVIAVGSDPTQVKLHFAGARKLKLTPSGDLIVVAKNGEIAFRKPVAYQLGASQRTMVEGRFVLLAENTVGFKLGTYDKGRALVVDPLLEYSTYLGGTGSDGAYAVAVDKEKNAYVTGFTMSPSPTFPTVNPYQKSNTDTANGVAFVTKLNAEGTALIYSTYLGGTGSCNPGLANESQSGDVGYAITVDGSGNAYVGGQTCSSDFPRVDPYQATNLKPNRGNAFVTKLNPLGNALIYSTYLGGSNGISGDWVQGIAVDESESVYVAGQAFSNNLKTTPGVFQPHTTAPGNTGFIAKFSPSGTSLEYLTYLGNNNSTGLYAIAIDSSRNAYVTGYTVPGGYPVTGNAYQPDYPGNPYISGSTVAFLTKLNSTGKTLLYSTYLGGSGAILYSLDLLGDGDVGESVAVDDSDNAYIAGHTYSHNFLDKGPCQAKNLVPNGGYTAFVVKLNTGSGGLVYCTYLGGSGSSSARGIGVDAGGDAYVTGYTYSYASNSTTGFPVTPNAYQSANNASGNNAYNAFFTELNAAGNGLVYSTYLGGSGNSSGNGDSANGIAVDAFGGVYLAGTTYSSNFPKTTGAFQPATKASPGNSNAFVSKFEFATASTITLVSDANPQKLGDKVTFTVDVTPSTGSTVPTGTVTFIIDNKTVATVPLDDTGHAEYATTTLSEGVHKVEASYSGDALNLASNSNTISETIYGPAFALTRVAGSGQTTVVGTAFKNLVVAVTDSDGDGVQGALVTFSGAGLKFSPATATTGSNGEAETTVTATAVGSLTATVSIGGSARPVTFSLDAVYGTVAEPLASLTVTIAEATSGATVYFTTDGTTPTSSSKKYTGPFTVTQTTTLKFIAVKADYTSSPVRTVVITVK